jgi:hypothetical protein
MSSAPWTDDRIEQVRALAAAGKTAAEAAAAIGGTTRDAVLGMAQRKGIVFPLKRRNGQPPERKPQPAGEERPIETDLDRFAELLADLVPVEKAGLKVYGSVRAGRLAMMQLEAKFGWGAE